MVSSPTLNGTWQRAFLFVFLACVTGGLTFAVLPRPEPRPHPRRSHTHPRLAYWFWRPEILENRTYLDHARDLVERGPFDIVFATPRYPHLGMDFVDVERFKPLFQEVVGVLKKGGVGLGLDLRFYLGVRGDIAPSERQGLVERVDVVLDETGKGAGKVAPDPLLFAESAPGLARPAGMRLLEVFGKEAVLTPVKVIRSSLNDGVLSLDCGPARAGEKVSALVLRNFNHPDMFSDAYTRAFRKVLSGYRDVGLAGAALDEFAYLPVKVDQWKKHLFYSEASARAFRKTHDTDLVDALARILLDQLADRTARIRALGRYHEHHRRAIARVEQRFYREVKSILGRDTFVGVHPTNQTLENYCDLEVSLTFLDWWEVPRDHGQTDEYTPLPVRMGLALKAGGPVWYHMFYAMKPDAILDEIVRCARYGGRVHYHAYFDAHHGTPLEKGDLLETLSRVEDRLCVLDRHVTTVPDLDTLVILGWPWMTFGPGQADGTSPYARTMMFLNRLWERGHRAAAVPTYEIASGHLKMADGKPTYGGRTFDRVLVYHPEFADEATLRFLVSLVQGRSRFRMVGGLTTRFDGTPAPLSRNLARFKATEEDVLKEPGPAIHEEGVRYPGNLRVFVDRVSLVDGSTVEKTVTVGGKKYPIRFSGAAVFEVKPGRAPRRLED